MTDTEKGAREVFEALKGDGDIYYSYFKEYVKTPEGFFWILKRLVENLNIDVEFTKAKRYYAFIVTGEHRYKGIGDNLEEALYQAVLNWVRDKKKGA